MKIWINTIPHSKQRYPTVGDWRIFEDCSIAVAVSEMHNEDYAFLVGIHEVVEAYLCKKRGITEESINYFDIAYEALRQEGDTSEPGDHPDAPYREEHRFATQIERIVSEELGIDWEEYEKAIYALG